MSLWAEKNDKSSRSASIVKNALVLDMTLLDMTLLFDTT